METSGERFCEFENVSLIIIPSEKCRENGRKNSEKTVEQDNTVCIAFVSLEYK
jgi:hypothetical protein